MIRKILNILYRILDNIYKLLLKHFRTHHSRPVYANKIKTITDGIKNEKILGIVVQGPIITKYSFTYETLKLYNNLFNSDSTFIILSTWKDLPLNQIEKIKELGVEVLLNEKPHYGGISNINYQIVSSKNGIKKAKELNVEYVIKTRTDQRMYAPNIANYLNSLLNVFPIKEQNFQKERIIGLSLNSFKYRLYGFSDMFQYGNIYDIDKYWDVELDQRRYSDEYINQNGSSLKKYAQLKLCEVYLTSKYLQSVGCNLNWTLEDSWEKFSKHFCIIDKESIDLYWPKYNSQEYRWLNYSGEYRMDEITFREWIDLSNLKGIQTYI